MGNFLSRKPANRDSIPSPSPPATPLIPQNYAVVSPKPLGPSMPNIPPEIYDQILAYAMDKRISLRSCALASPHFMDINRRYLLQHIVLNSPEKWEQFQAFIDGSSPVPELAVVLDFYIEPFIWKALENVDQTTLEKLSSCMASFRNLKTLRIRFQPPIPPEKVPPTVSSNLARIVGALSKSANIERFDVVANTFPSALRVVSQFNHLKHFVIEHESMPLPEYQQMATMLEGVQNATPIMLESLEMTFSKTSSQHLFNWVLHPQNPVKLNQLQRLIIHTQDGLPGHIRLLLIARLFATSLKVLLFEPSTDVSTHQSTAVQDPLNLSVFKNLHHLGLSVDYANFGISTDPEDNLDPVKWITTKLDSLDKATNQIQILELHFYYTFGTFSFDISHWKVVVTAIIRNLPRLRLVDIRISGNEFSSEIIRRMEEHLKPLRDICTVQVTSWKYPDQGFRFPDTLQTLRLFG